MSCESINTWAQRSILRNNLKKSVFVPGFTDEGSQFFTHHPLCDSPQVMFLPGHGARRNCALPEQLVYLNLQTLGWFPFYVSLLSQPGTGFKNKNLLMIEIKNNKSFIVIKPNGIDIFNNIYFKN